MPPYLVLPDYGMGLAKTGERCFLNHIVGGKQVKGLIPKNVFNKISYIIFLLAVHSATDESMAFIINKSIGRKELYLFIWLIWIKDQNI